MSHPILAAFQLQQAVMNAFVKAYPEVAGRVKVDICFEGNWVGWHFDADLVRSAAPLNLDGKSG